MAIDAKLNAPRQAPWQNIITAFPPETKFKDAIKLAGLDYKVAQVPVAASTSQGWQYIENRSATIRTDTDQVLGIVGSRYTIVQNAEAFSFLEQIVDSGEVVPLGGGQFRQGARPFLQARLPEDITVNGDAHVPFIFVATSHDGGIQVTVALSAIRVVCENTYAANLHSPRRFQVRHLSSVTGRIEEARKVLGISFSYFKEYADLMERLGNRPLDNEQFMDLANRLFPLVEAHATEEQREKVAKKRAELLAVYLHSPNVPRGTKYGALQAVTEWYDHVKNGRGTKDLALRAERKTEDILLGDGVEWKDRALALITNA